MTVLHGAWIAGNDSQRATFALWGERSPTAKTPKPRPPRKRRDQPVRPPPHPFALTTDAIRHTLSVLGLTHWATVAQVHQCVATLPTFEDAPTRSTEPPPDPSALRLAPWIVQVVALDPVASVVFLPRLAAASAENPALVADDLRAWIVAARFALSLLARQRLVPTLRIQHDAARALWAASVDEPADRANLRALEASLPSSALALAWKDRATTPLPREALTDYVAAVVDGVARRAPIPPPTGSAPSRRRASVEDAWLAALSREDPFVLLPAEDARALQGRLSLWADTPALGATDTAFRLCFRLTPPPTPAWPSAPVSSTPPPPPASVPSTVLELAASFPPEPPSPAPLPAPSSLPSRSGSQPAWLLDYLLQATDDPSLLVPLHEVWRHRGAEARFLQRRFDQPQERVLASLGRASRLFPPIESSLRTARPESTTLTTREAADFVRDKALLLKASGFGVLLPGLETRLGVRLRLRGERRERTKSNQNDGPSRLDFHHVISYDWELALGDQPLTPEEFEMLARLKEPLVQVRGQWVDVRPDQIERALTFIKKHQQDGQMPLGEALATALAPGSLDGLPLTHVQTTGWIDELLEEVSAASAPRKTIDQPPGLHGTLRPYQQRGVAWLDTHRRFGLGALLADDMGLGKTLQTIATLLQARADAGEQPLPPTLVISPTSVVGNWRREIERFAPGLRVHVHHGAGRAGEDAFARVAAEHDVILSTYALLHRDQAALGRVAWDGIVLDEAQNVKNPDTHAARVARTLPSRWRVALTGTPVENRLSELWSIFNVVNPGYLGTAEQFRQQFALPIERAADADATARLKALVSPFILRRVKTDRSIIADLPEKNEMKVYCSLTREQATLYEAVVRDAMKPIEDAEGIQRRGMVLALLTRLKQVCNHPALLLHDRSEVAGRSGKLARLGEMLEEVVAVDERALVFTQYAEMGDMLRDYLRDTLDREVLFLHGGTPMAERDRLVAQFQQDSHGPPVFVLSLKAGGTGLNLTRANHVFHFDRWWNPAVENQATDRAFRIGQTRNVQVHKYVCAGTFEEALDDLIQRKLALAQSIVGTSETWITEMSTRDLRDLFTLRREAALPVES